jgi:hypothetical protein
VLPKKYYISTAIFFAVCVVSLWHALGIWGFQSHLSVANAVKSGKLREGMTEAEVASLLGSNWRKTPNDHSNYAYDWCRFLECIQFDEGRVYDWDIHPVPTLLKPFLNDAPPVRHPGHVNRPSITLSPGDGQVLKNNR